VWTPARKVAESTIPGIYVRVIIGVLEENGDINTLTILDEQCPWLPKIIEDMADVNAIQFMRFTEILSKQTCNPNLGLEIGRRLPPHSHGVVGNLMLSAPTLQAGLESLPEFYTLVVPFLKGSVYVEGYDFVIKIACNIPVTGNAFQFLMDIMYGTYDKMIQFFSGHDKNISSISIMSDTPPQADYQQVLGAKLFVGKADYKINIPAETARLSSPFSCHELFKEYTVRCLNRTLLTGHRDVYTNKIKEHINNNIGHNWTLDDISQHFNVSISTLQRKLQSEGNNFRDIVSTEKIITAKNKLATTIESIVDIAHELGYSDTSNFCSAFKRKENISPNTYREMSKQALQQ